MSRNQNWSFLRQDKNKNTWLFSSLLDLQYVHRTLKQTLAPCGPQVARVYFTFLWTCWRLNKLEKGQVGKLVQHQLSCAEFYSSLLAWKVSLSIYIFLNLYVNFHHSHTTWFGFMASFGYCSLYLHLFYADSYCITLVRLSYTLLSVIGQYSPMLEAIWPHTGV